MILKIYYFFQSLLDTLKTFEGSNPDLKDLSSQVIEFQEKVTIACDFLNQLESNESNLIKDLVNSNLALESSDLESNGNQSKVSSFI